MINKQKFQTILDLYKKDFVPLQWPKEMYKWQAIKHFQDHWNVMADDFASMLRKALLKTYNLLASQSNYPAKTILNFAEKEPETVRGMFIDLFDETNDYYSRIKMFKVRCDELSKKYIGKDGQHFQSENAISVYLWLRFPDKHYIYKFSEVKNVADELESKLVLRKGAYASNLRSFMSLYSEISSLLHLDEEIKAMLKSNLTMDCYPDPYLCTLTIDVCFYISRVISKGIIYDTSKEVWLFNEYSPQIGIDMWKELIAEHEIVTNNSLILLKRFYEIQHEVTWKQLADSYGETPFFYHDEAVALAKRVAEFTECDLIDSEVEELRWLFVMLRGRYSDPNVKASFQWKLRDELFYALQDLDSTLSIQEPIKPYVVLEEPNTAPNHWLLIANPKIWSFSGLAVGEIINYTLTNDNGNKRRIYQNFLDAKKGDLVIGYESNPVKKVVALAVVSKEQDGKVIRIQKTEGLVNPIDYSSLKENSDLTEMEYFRNPQGSLFKLTNDEYSVMMDLIRDVNPIPQKGQNKTYLKSHFLSEVFLSEYRYDQLVSTLKNKRNIILQGAPGVGKTFAAKRLAYSMMGEKDDSRIEFVQFHQSYSYEDFIMGYKPTKEGFELRSGIFYQFCQKAANNPDKEYFFIIDEINRGNLSRIFGELLMLVERDYRGEKATLAYNGLPFSVPEKLYIIGMMNTADRSLALIDYALRRRFSFFEMEPAFESDGFLEYQRRLNDELFDELITQVKALNKEIMADPSLGKGFCIGHSFFIRNGICTEEWIRSIVDFDILPMLQEYWFDDAKRITRWEHQLKGMFQ